MKLEASGNGTGYDGKIGDSFYNMTPDFRCNGQETFTARLTKTASGFRFTENTNVGCGTSTQDIQESDLDFSPYHKELAGFRGKIFEYSETEISKIPDRLVEAWCFDTSGRKNVEVIQQYNHVAKTATARLIYSNANGVQRSAPFSTARFVDNQGALFEGTDYRLKIDRQTPSDVLGSFDSTLDVQIEGQISSLKMSCRIGGYLDSNLWPAKVIFSGDVSQEAVSAVASKIYGVIRDGAKFSIYENDLTGKATPRLLPNLPYTGYGSDVMKLSPDGNYLVYRDNSTALYSYHIPTGKLYTLAANTGAGVDRDFQISTKHVYFTSYTYLDQKSRRTAVRVSLTGDDSLTFYDSGYLEPGRASSNMYMYNFSPQMDALLYTASNADGTIFDFFNLRSDSNVPFKVTPNFTAEMRMGSPLMSRQVQNLLFFTIHRIISPDEITGEVYVTRTDGGTPFAIGLNGYASNVVLTPSGRYAYIEKFEGTPGFGTNRVGYVFETGATGPWVRKTAPLLRAVVATRDEAFYGLDGSSLFRIDANSGVTTRVCAEVGELQQYFVAPSGKAYLLTADKKSAVLYAFEPQAGCRKVNEAPVNSSFGTKLYVSPDETQALIQGVALSGNFYDFWTQLDHSDLYWVPINGQSIIRVNTPDLSFNYNQTAQFTPDSKAVIFIAKPLFLPTRLHVWKTPQLVQ